MYRVDKATSTGYQSVPTDSVITVGIKIIQTADQKKLTCCSSIDFEVLEYRLSSI